MFLRGDSFISVLTFNPHGSAIVRISCLLFIHLESNVNLLCLLLYWIASLFWTLLSVHIKSLSSIESFLVALKNQQRVKEIHDSLSLQEKLCGKLQECASNPSGFLYMLCEEQSICPRCADFITASLSRHKVTSITAFIKTRYRDFVRSLVPALNKIKTTQPLFLSVWLKL